MTHYIIFSNVNSNCSNLLDLRNLQEKVKKAFCYLKLFWPFTVWINCSSDLKKFANSWPSASNFKSFSRSLEQFFHTVGQNNFGNKIPFIFINFFSLFRCNRLTELNLANTSITNNSVGIIIEYLKHSLKKIDFTYTNIHFSAFLPLQSMPKLKGPIFL